MATWTRAMDEQINQFTNNQTTTSGIVFEQKKRYL